MEITTSRFGLLDVRDESILTFSAGLLGFKEHTRYALLEDERGVGYQWLQSVDDGNLAFVIVQPGFLKSDYQVEVQDDALAELDFQEGDSIVLFAVITIPPGEPEKATANLQGPLVINFTRKKGKQIILNESFPIRYAFIDNQNEADETVGKTAEVVKA